MARSNDNVPIFSTLIGNFPPGDITDPTEANLLRVREVGLAWDGVNPDHCNMVPALIPPRRIDQQTCSGPPDPGTIFRFKPAYDGSPNGMIDGMVADSTKAGSTTIPGNNDLYMRAIMGIQTKSDATKPLEGTHAKSDPKKDKRSGTPVIRQPSQKKPYIPLNEVMNKPHYGRSYSERGRPWQAETNIATSETPFAGLINSNMLSQLPGKAMSLANAFKSLSSGQKQKIRDSVSPETYNIINSVLETAIDEGDDPSVLSLTSRVHPETFANNLVDLLCQCTNYTDIVNVMGEMRDNISLHGKEKLPKVEFKIKSAYGDVGIIIDGQGEVSQNVSNSVAAAEAAFNSLLLDNTVDSKAIAKFYGHINGTTLTVTDVRFGEISIGPNHEIFGIDVTDDTYIVSTVKQTGNTGTYIVNNTSNTLPNIEMVLIKTQVRQPSAASSGGGGLVGTIPGQNFFGEASKLISEILPVLEPQNSQKIQQLMQKISSDKNQIAGMVQNWKGPVENSFRQYLKKVGVG
jgi:hypothetical protein